MVYYEEWDDRGFILPDEFVLDENSKLHEAIDVFYRAGGYDFFQVVTPAHYASNWLNFIGELYSEIINGTFQADGWYHKNPLTEEQKAVLVEQGVPEVFTADLE